MTLHFPRHRNGRPVSDLLRTTEAAHGDTTARPDRGPRTGSAIRGLRPATRRRALPDDLAHRRQLQARDDKVVAAIGARADTALFNTASSTRMRAHDALARISLMRNRVRTAARAAGPDFTGRRTAMTDLHRTTARIQKASRTLAAALDAIDRAIVRVARTERGVQRFHPYGGTRVATIPTRRIPIDHLARAQNLLDAAHQIATRSTRELDLAITDATTTLTRVEKVLDRVVAAPPPALRLVRLAMPRTQRHDWWRELCSTFAETTPAERRQTTRSYLIATPRIIWTSWATTPRATRKSAAHHDNP